MELKANILIVEGKLSSNPTITHSKDGLPLTKFTVTNGEMKFNVKAYGKLAEISNMYLRENDSVIISGKLRKGKRSDSVTAYDIRFLARRK